MNSFIQTIQPLMEMLGSLGVAVCCFDPEDRAVAWNRCFLQFFPEQSGHVHEGEPYAENLRRFYAQRLSAEELPHIERYVADGVARHRGQFQPFEFHHRGRWLRVASLPVAAQGRMRLWMQVPTPSDGETVARELAASGAHRMPDGLDSLADGVLVCNPDGAILFANPRFADLYQIDPITHPPIRFEDLLACVWDGHPGAASALDSVRDSLRFPGAPFIVPLPGRRWVRCSALRGHDGTTVSTHVDVTAMHRAQRDAAEARQRAEVLAASLAAKMAELEAANRQNELLLELLPGALLRARYLEEPPLKVLYRSPKTAELSGFAMHEMTDGTLAARMSTEDRLRLRAKVREALKSGGASSVEANFQHANGSWRRLHVTIRAVTDVAARDEVVMLWTDVTEERMRLIQDAQASRLLTLGEMAGGIAHELNQPLTSISLLSATATMELTANPAAREVVLGKLRRIGDQALRAGRIIHTLHDMTRPGDSALEPVCLHDAVAQTRLLVDQMMANTEITLDIDLPAGLPRVMGDQTRIQQSLMNLFSNARDALNRIAPPRTIRVFAKATAQSVVLTVVDNAGGIALEVIDRVFDPFFTTKGPDQGTGLGLSIARSALRSMQGDLTVRNGAEGAEFSLTLRPAHPA